MAGGLVMAFMCWLVSLTFLDKLIKSGDANSPLWLPWLFLLPIVVVICHYGGEFIDYLKKIERILDNIEKSVDNTKEETDRHLHYIEDRMKDIEERMDDMYYK